MAAPYVIAIMIVTIIFTKKYIPMIVSQNFIFSKMDII